MIMHMRSFANPKPFPRHSLLLGHRTLDFWFLLAFSLAIGPWSFFFPCLSAQAAELAYKSVTATDLITGCYDDTNVEITGTVDDAFRDEIDRHIGFLALNDGLHVALVTFNAPDMTDAAIADYIGTTVRVRGRSYIERSPNRQQAGRLITSTGGIQILRPAPDNLFDVPSVSALTNTISSEIPRMGRHRARGRVAAVWGKDRILLATDGGGQCIAQLRVAPPAYGEFVEAAGLPETDAYRINLTRAIWRKIPDEGIPNAEDPVGTDKGVVTLQNGCLVYDADRYGRPTRIRGTVRTLPTDENGNLFYMDADGATVAIDASSVPAVRTTLKIDATAEVTGACVFDINSRRIGAAMPRIEGYRIVLRTPADVIVLRQPPWWTTGRLLAVIVILLVGIGTVAFWSFVQRRFAQLRFNDRTRLAVELHDSVSQNLTGMSMQVDAARKLVATSPERAANRLTVASRTIGSCREELRNCIRDLRDNALDCPDMSQAVRTVLAPYQNDAHLSVRFNVSRRHISDNVAHAVFRIVRELVVNAARHGKANNIRVAGALDGKRLLFSVSDDGCGFDPSNCPGIAEGHFGLAGIAERMRALKGEMTFDSTPGRGTRISVVLSKLQ